MTQEPPTLGPAGYLVLPSAVEPDLCGRVRASLEPWARRHRNPGEKLQDAWMRSRAVRELATHPVILSELARLYGRRPLPFQTLDLARGTQQPLHSDSAHFDSVPGGWMCGVWVALERVAGLQGPLVLVPGSQAAARQVFNEVLAGSQPFVMRQYKHELASRLRALPMVEFHAEPGDALVWHADLAHGGVPITDPGTTRWSQITHYFFEGFSYVTPMRSDPSSGAVHLREHLVDISTMRSIVNCADASRVRFHRTAAGRSILFDGSGVPGEFAGVPQLTSALRGVARRAGSELSRYRHRAHLGAVVAREDPDRERPS